APIHQARPGPVHVGRRGCPLYRLCGVMGTGHPGPCPPGRGQGRTGSGHRGLSFGAPTEGEIEIAEEIAARIPSIEKLRLVSSGTEATMTAIRLARGATGRSKIIKFEGCYH